MSLFKKGMCQNDKILCKTRDSARGRQILKVEASDTWENFLILKCLVHVNIFSIFLVTLFAQYFDGS